MKASPVPIDHPIGIAGADGTPAFRGALVSQAGAHAALRDHIRELKAAGAAAAS